MNMLGHASVVHTEYTSRRLAIIFDVPRKYCRAYMVKSFVNLHDIYEALLLILAIPWSSKHVEEMHGTFIASS